MGSLEIILFAVLMLIYLLILGVAIACYVVSSYAGYTIAKRLYIKNPWLAWIPIGNYWIDGCIANLFDERQGCNRKWQKVLVTLAAIVFGMVLLTYVVMIGMMIYTFVNQEYMDDTSAGFIGAFIIMYIILIFAVLVSLALQVCHAICRYKIFEALAPQKAIKYIILDTIVPMAGPICMLKHKDKCDPLWKCADESHEVAEEQYNTENYF